MSANWPRLFVHRIWSYKECLCTLLKLPQVPCALRFALWAKAVQRCLVTFGQLFVFQTTFPLKRLFVFCTRPKVSEECPSIVWRPYELFSVKETLVIQQILALNCYLDTSVATGCSLLWPMRTLWEEKQPAFHVAMHSKLSALDSVSNTGLMLFSKRNRDLDNIPPIQV